jgi:signal transduction histidine kinase
VQPIRVKERIAGIFVLLWLDAPHAFTPEELRLVEAVARQAAVALEDAELVEEVNRLNRDLEERVLDRTAELAATLHELRESRGEFRALSARLQSLREEDRARVAREIHDELGQALTALKFELARVIHRPTRKALRTELKRFSSTIDASLAAVRRISTELRPPVLDELGIAAALEWLATEFGRRTGIHCGLECPSDLDADRERSTALFRICQEALTNSARHANATRVDVRLSLSGDVLHLEVRNDGRGVPPRAPSRSRSLGLLGMRERAAQLGGEVTIEPNRPRGTDVLARLPRSERPRPDSEDVPHPDL